MQNCESGREFIHLKFFLDFHITLAENRPTLRAQLECQYGLVDLLVSKGALSDEQGADITRPEHNAYEQNDKLLDLLLHSVDAKQHQLFIDALRQTHQRYIAALLSPTEGNCCAYI